MEERRGRGRRAATPRRRDEELMRAAGKVFYERGYADATVQHVADELGILKGSLYHYIDSKEDLLLRLFDRLHADVDRILEEVASEPGLEPLERLELYIRRQILYNLDNLEPIAIYYRDVKRVGEASRAAMVERRKVHERFVARLIEQAQAAGEADPRLDAKLAGNCVFASIIWTYRWYRPDGRSSREEIAALCTDFVLGGVVGEPALSGLGA
jgi:TetR/AcrR family transcriptional regulator, cholesterol catabolism regulator